MNDANSHKFILIFDDGNRVTLTCFSAVDGTLIDIHWLSDPTLEQFLDCERWKNGKYN